MANAAQLSVVKDFIKLVELGTNEIKKNHNVTEEQAIIAAIIYGTEWLVDNKPELAKKWVKILDGE
jgi:hypothetical protein